MTKIVGPLPGWCMLWSIDSRRRVVMSKYSVSGCLRSVRSRISRCPISIYFGGLCVVATISSQLLELFQSQCLFVKLHVLLLKPPDVFDWNLGTPNFGVRTNIGCTSFSDAPKNHTKWLGMVRYIKFYLIWLIISHVIFHYSKVGYLVVHPT